jgi:6-phosphogluconolactonase (cycloisomerase 2 family)
MLAPRPELRQGTGVPFFRQLALAAGLTLALGLGGAACSSTPPATMPDMGMTNDQGPTGDVQADAQGPDGPGPDGGGGPPTNMLYVETNDPTTNMNAILAFQRDPQTGDLTQIAGSPFLTGGTGVSNPMYLDGPNDDDHQVIASPDHTLLFAVNGGSNTIAVFHINSDGSLTAVAGSPFPSGGVEPASMGITGNKLYVTNKNLDPGQPMPAAGSNRTGFTIGADGSLTPITGSTVATAPDASAFEALVERGGKVLIDAEEGSTQALRSYLINDDGTLTEAPTSPNHPPMFMGMAPLPLGLVEHPSMPILYVGWVNVARLAVYTINLKTADLTYVTDVANGGNEICWLITDQAGKNLYSANMLDTSISRYDITDPMAPVEKQHIILPIAGKGGTFDIALSPDEQFLYVASERGPATTDHTDPSGNAISIFTLNADGSIPDAPSNVVMLPVPPEASPQGLVVF